MTATVRDLQPTDARTKRPVYQVTLARVVHSEWAKFWTVRSTKITLAVIGAAIVAFGLIASSVYNPHSTAARASGGDMDAVALALSGTVLAQLAAGVLGVLVSAGEYSTGMIRSTVSAVPRRLPVLWAKVAVVGAVVLVVSVVAILASFGVGSAELREPSMRLTLGDSGVLRSLAGGAGYLTLVAILGVALGMLLRSVAGGIAVLAALLLIVSGLVSLLPGSWSDAITPYLPDNAGTAMMSLGHKSDLLSPGAGFLVLIAWAAAVLAAAGRHLSRSDV